MPVAENRLEQLQVLKLLQSVRQENAVQIEKLTTNGIPNLINYSEPSNGETALHLAACANNELIISHLLQLGASPNVYDLLGRTPAMRAAEYGHLQALQLLADADADLTAKDKEGKNILYYCIHSTKRHQECMELCLKYGAYQHNVGNDGQSLTVVAAKEKLSEQMRIILTAGVDPDKQLEKTGESSLHIASANGSVECVRALLEYGANVNILDNDGNHASHRAAANGHLNILRILSAYGGEFGKFGSGGNTPLHLAASKGHAAICKFLAQRGCPATAKNSNGRTPRLLAKDEDQKEAMKEVRKAERAKPGKPGTDLWAVRFYDWMVYNSKMLTEEMWKIDPEVDGTRKGKIAKPDFISILQSANCPLKDDQLKTIGNVHDPNKIEMIDYNLFLTGKKFVNKLYTIDGGKKKKKGGGGKKGGRRKKGKTKIVMPICVSPDGPRTKKGGPPANYLEKYVHFTDNSRFDRDNPPDHPIQDDSAWYLTYPDKTYVSVTGAARFGDIETLKNAFLRGTHVDQQDQYYKTPLMTACLEGNLEMVKFLVEQNADINAKDNFKWTPLHFAAHMGQLDVVRYLVDNGAELDAQTANGGTPIMRAIESSREGVVLFMIEKGAKIQMENKKGQSSLDIAKAYADPRIIAIVQKRWDEIPPPLDKKRMRGNRKKPKSASPEKKTNPAKETNHADNDQLAQGGEEVQKRKSSVLRAASVIGMAQEKDDSITFTPKRVWVAEPKTTDLLIAKEIRRQRFGYEVDFPDYQPPFQKTIGSKAAEIEAAEET
eukprot:gene15808-17402_t